MIVKMDINLVLKTPLLLFGDQCFLPAFVLGLYNSIRYAIWLPMEEGLPDGFTSMKIFAKLA